MRIEKIDDDRIRIYFSNKSYVQLFKGEIEEQEPN